MAANEPMTMAMTMATDFLLGAVAAAWGVRLLMSGRRTGQRSVRAWGAGVVAIAGGTIAGGAWHGFLEDLAPATLTVLWALTGHLTGLGALLLIVSAAIASARAGPRRVLIVCAAVKFAAFAVWEFGNESFLPVALDYGGSLLVVAALQVSDWRRRRAPGAPWIVAGCVVSGAGVAIQRVELAPAPWFDHNALYHVVTIGALWLLCVGAARFADRDGATDAGRPAQ